MREKDGYVTAAKRDERDGTFWRVAAANHVTAWIQLVQACITCLFVYYLKKMYGRIFCTKDHTLDFLRGRSAQQERSKARDVIPSIKCKMSDDLASS